MKKYVIAVIIVCCFLFVQVAFADRFHQLGVGVRKHVRHSVLTELPFSNGDVSYGIAYEFHEAKAYWQLVLDYASQIAGDDSVDFVLTPQLNFINKGDFFRTGVGILKNYINSDDSKNWTDFYWQFLLGAHFGVTQKLGLDLYGYYVFENWSEIDEFDVEDIEFGAWLSFSF